MRRPAELSVSPLHHTKGRLFGSADISPLRSIVVVGSSSVGSIRKEKSYWLCPEVFKSQYNLVKSCSKVSHCINSWSTWITTTSVATNTIRNSRNFAPSIDWGVKSIECFLQCETKVLLIWKLLSVQKWQTVRILVQSAKGLWFAVLSIQVSGSLRFSGCCMIASSLSLTVLVWD